MSDRFDDLLKRAKALRAGDLAGLRAMIDDMLAGGFTPMECELLLKAAATACKSRIGPVRKLFDETQAETERAKQNTPEAREAERRAREAAEEAARIVRDAARDQLWRACGDLALASNFINRMEAMAHRLGVVGERSAIGGAYLAMTSRLLRDTAISFLRRGAPAGGKNYLISSVARLMPKESVISISSASPMALIYHGDDADALKHKIIIVAEAAAIAQKDIGDEHPMTIMLRTLLSEGRIDREVAITQRDGVPKTVHVQRNGPVCLMLTSARENVDQEMLTRLITSDADESRNQTLAVVKRTLLGAPAPVAREEIESWLDFQRWLEFDAPYDVAVPFAAAIYEAYEELIEDLPNALQVRMRRDIAGLITGIKASTVLHKAQRQTDQNGRIVAELADYRHAWNAFNQSAASLYGVKMRPEVIAVVEAAAKLGAKKKDPNATFTPESAKITVGALRKEIGINSNDVAYHRLKEAVESGALEEDDSKRGSGRGRPRYYWIRKTSDELRVDSARGVFPPPHSVQKIFFRGRERSENHGQNGQNEQSKRVTSTSCPSYPFYPSLLDPSLALRHMPQKTGGDPSCAQGKGNGASSMSPEEVVLAAHADGAAFNLFDDRTGFTIDLRLVADPVIRNLLSDAIGADYQGILSVLVRGAEPP